MTPRLTARVLAALLLAVLLVSPATQRAEAQDYDTRPTRVGYIDSAIPFDQVRLRFDAVYDINRSDRAEYIYQRGADPRIAYQDISEYFEYAFGQRFSSFVEIHEHYVNPTQAPNDYGLGDTIVGFKAVLFRNEDMVDTFQLRTYIPTGNPLKILGAGHASIEPAFLFNQKLSDRWLLEGEIKDWIPLTENSFAGNILNYGVGVSYRAYQSGRFSVSPVAEVVGWTCLGGKETIVPPDGNPPDVTPVDNTSGFAVKSAAGDTIINSKFGVRVRWGEYSSFYAGYGRAITGDFWYKNMFRLEYRLAF